MEPSPHYIFSGLDGGHWSEATAGREAPCSEGSNARLRSEFHLARVAIWAWRMEAPASRLSMALENSATADRPTICTQRSCSAVDAAPNRRLQSGSSQRAASSRGSAEAVVPSAVQSPLGQLPADARAGSRSMHAGNRYRPVRKFAVRRGSDTNHIAPRAQRRPAALCSAPAAPAPDRSRSALRASRFDQFERFERRIVPRRRPRRAARPSRGGCVTASPELLIWCARIDHRTQQRGNRR